MNVIPSVSSVYRPRLAREFALDQSEIAAITVNGINGALAVASIAIAIAISIRLTTSLMVVMTVLYGPLVGFIVSSVYTGIEKTVGSRLGGKASHGVIYRLYAWSFLPLWLAALVASLIASQYSWLGTWTIPLAVILCLVFAVFSIRNYWANVLYAHQFSRARGAVSLVLTLLLFIVLMAVSIGVLLFFFTYGTWMF